MDYYKILAEASDQEEEYLKLAANVQMIRPVEAVEAMEKAVQQMASSSRNWPEDFKDENGCYQNECRLCKKPFLGYKYRRVCKECSQPSTNTQTQNDGTKQ